jgi:hypothetical protein
MRSLATVSGILVLCGILARKMWEQPIWYPQGWTHFLWFVAVYGIVSTAIVALRPSAHKTFFSIFVLLITIGAVGPGPVAALAFILASCFALGRLLRPKSAAPESILLGLACFMLLVQALVHFPINYPAVYAAILAIPIVWNWRAFRELRWTAASAGRTETAAQALGIFPLLCHWAVVLKPETGPDALSMHLANPMSIAANHQGSFDAQHMIQAVMPMGGEWVYTIAFLLGGEFCARLMNLALLVILCVLLFRAALRWVDRPRAWLLVALFASLPVVQMVTGSLYVENIWAVFLLAAYLSIDDVLLCAVFAGAAIMTKLLAAAFAVPILLCRRPRLAALALAALWALPPYVEAYLRTGNPVFPYMNNVFRSPYFDTESAFTYERMNEKLGPAALYHLTFDTRRYVEGQDGAFGFQFLLFLPLLPFLMWKRRPFPEWRTFAVVFASSILILSAAPHMRYLYPAMALATILIALLLSELGRTGVVLCVACVTANLCFLPAASWIHKDFALNPFDASAVDRFLTAGAPTRKLIDYMNAKHPGAPVLFLETLEVAGLRAKEYSNAWHHYSFQKRLGEAEYPDGLAKLFAECRLRYVIAPVQRPVRQIAVAQYLRANAVREFENGDYAIFALRDGPPAPARLETMAAGEYDDASPAILYSGGWECDTQFAEPRDHTLSYSRLPGSSVRFAFTGHELVYVYTKAPNRGTAAVSVDGVPRGKLSLKSPNVEWRQQTVFNGLGDGRHELEILVINGYVDVDALLVR